MGYQKNNRARVEIEIRNEKIELLGDKAILWNRNLIVADLHWGKAETFRQAGIPIPDALHLAELTRLASLVRSHPVDTVLFLGDLVHAKSGITSELSERIVHWRNSLDVEMVLVRGNHERNFVAPAEWRMAEVTHREAGPFFFGHEPRAVKNRYVFCGHLHPTYRIVGAGDQLRLPCFYVSHEFTVIPAFSDFTRGVVVSPREDDRVFVVADEKVIEVTR